MTYGCHRAYKLSMDSLTAIAASGLRSRMESLELLANNVANASTGGYKADREFYSIYASPEALESDPAATMPVIEKPWTDFSQGIVYSTANPLDMALSGKGFFAVDGPAGPLYTRNGNFHLGADGRLVTSEGFAVRGVRPVSTSGGAIEVSNDGTVQQDGAALGKLELSEFSNAAALSKQGSNYFQANDPASKPSVPGGTSVQQGRLEASNTGSAEAAVRLVSVMRQFEMLQKAVSLGLDMNRQALEQVAKVGS